jgi:hypothetical protein
MIDQQKVAADMAFGMIRPGALKRVIGPFRRQRIIVGDQQQQHHLFQLGRVVAAAQPRDTMGRLPVAALVL